MKTLIAYATNQGTTEKVALKIAEGLEGETTLVNLKKDKNPAFAEFDRIVIGGSIHAGGIQKEVKEFATKNLSSLLTKKTGLFICCMEEENPEKYLEQFFPAELRDAALATVCPGGEFLFEKMNFIERAIIKKMAKTDQNVSKIDNEKIKEFVAKLSWFNKPSHNVTETKILKNIKSKVFSNKVR